MMARAAPRSVLPPDGLVAKQVGQTERRARDDRSGAAETLGWR